MNIMSGSDFNILLASGVIMALAAVIFVYRMNRELERQQKERALEASTLPSHSTRDT